MRLTRKHMITPKGEDEYRDKFVIILGKDKDCYFGVLIINTKLGYPESEHYPIKGENYKFLSYTSYVNCSQIKHIDAKTMLSGDKKDTVNNTDLELIRECVKNSKLITPKDKKRYGLI